MYAKNDTVNVFDNVISIKFYFAHFMISLVISRLVYQMIEIDLLVLEKDDRQKLCDVL